MIEQFYFVITERCNLTCTHCIRDSSPWRNDAAEAPMLINAIGQIAKNHPDSLVLLSGGEPTIHRNFREILDFSLTAGLKTNINSNGMTSFFTSKNLQTIENRSRLFVQISLDGDETTHNKIRGTGSYQKTLRAINRLIENGIVCSVSTTVIDTNFFERAEQFIQSLDSLNLAHISIKRATYAGRASSGLSMDTTEWNQLVYRLRTIPWKTRLHLFPMYDFLRLDSIADEALAEFRPSNAAINCGAGTAKVYIYSNGDVCACTCFKGHPMGNLYHNPLAEILKSHRPIQVEHPTCSTCRYFNICRGGCLGSGYQTSGQLGRPDPRCPKIEMSLPSKRTIFLQTFRENN